MKMDADTIWYSLCREDTEAVAKQLGIKLTKKELDIVENIVPDSMPWWDTIACIIKEVVNNRDKPK
jgi:hypothetical protein